MLKKFFRIVGKVLSLAAVLTCPIDLHDMNVVSSQKFGLSTHEIQFHKQCRLSIPSVLRERMHIPTCQA